MITIYNHSDLFTTSTKYLVHCISADFALGAGIAKEFEARYHLRKYLKQQYPYARTGMACLVDNVFNLVTKERYWQKPTYKSLLNALVDLRRQCIELGITELAMPAIGCGLDRLHFNIVKDTITSVFDKSGINIKIYLKGEF